MLKFSTANAKLQALKNVPELKNFLAGKRKVFSFDLLSGWSCPFAHECLAKVEVVTIDGKKTKKLKDGKDAHIRCFSASQEVIYTNVYNMRKSNMDLIRKEQSVESMAVLINESIPVNAGIIRIHVAGDFLNQNYFDAWLSVALNNPDKLFYAYTKSLPYWVNNIAIIPDNMILTASKGGRADHMIEQYNLRSVIVVNSNYQAKKLKLKVDHTDECAARPNLKHKDFALLIHGIQQAGTKASKAISRMKKGNIKFSYNRKDNLKKVA